LTSGLISLRGLANILAAQRCEHLQLTDRVTLADLWERQQVRPLSFSVLQSADYDSGFARHRGLSHDSTISAIVCDSKGRRERRTE